MSILFTQRCKNFGIGGKLGPKCRIFHIKKIFSAKIQKSQGKTQENRPKIAKLKNTEQRRKKKRVCIPPHAVKPVLDSRFSIEVVCVWYMMEKRTEVFSVLKPCSKPGALLDDNENTKLISNHHHSGKPPRGQNSCLRQKRRVWKKKSSKMRFFASASSSVSLRRGVGEVWDIYRMPST